MKKVIQKLIIICIVISMVIIQTIGECKAEGEKVTMQISMAFPFHYREELQQTYMILQYGNKVAYKLNRSIYPISNNYSEIEPYNNDEIIKIIELGYPNIEVEKLGLTSTEQAYATTQEAIYAVLENKDLELYEQEAPLGIKMINAIKKISSGIGENDLLLTEKAKGWTDDVSDNSYCYKDYKVTMKSRIIENSISLIEEENCKITNEQGNQINKVLDNQVIRLTVPKGKEQTVNIKVNYVIKTPKLYKIVDDKGIEYLIVDFYNQDRQYEYKVNTKESVLVTIKNYNKETNLPIKGNKFQVLDKNNNIYLKSLETNEDGEIKTYLDIGNYYIKQIETQEGDLQKEILKLDITGDEENIKLNIFNTTLKKEETVENETETNIEEENKEIIENHIKDVINVHTSNIEKEIINETNETNMHNINYFINTINRKNIANLTKENTYENEIFEDTVTYNKVLPGESSKTTKTRREYQSYVDSIKSSAILPVAFKQ